jgi:superfamily II DNA helicase RecQ
MRNTTTAHTNEYALQQAVTTVFMKIVRTLAASGCLRAIFVDEFHLARQWSDFRPEYKWVVILRQLTGVVWCFLSATASDRMVENVLQDYRIDSKTTIRLPGFKKGMYLEIRHKPGAASSDRYPFIPALVDEIENNVRDGGPLPPRTILFCNSMLEADTIFAHVRHAIKERLGENAYKAPGAHYGDGRILRYHARTPAEVVKYIHSRFVADAEDCPARILVTTAIGVHGVDFVNVTRALLIGAPGTVAEMYQAIGRAGRPAGGGERRPVFAAVYTNGSDFTERRTYDADMKRLMRLEVDRTACIQKEALKAISEDIP